MVAAAVVIVLVLTLAALPLTVFPESAAVPSEPDVVVVLAGGKGERLATARTLMDRAVGPPAGLLLISNGDAPGWPEANAMCGTAAESYAIACFRPRPDTTAGEARVLGELARAQGWDRIAIVTSTYHATRARMRVERCVDAQVEIVAAASDGPLLDRVRTSAREMVALARDLLDAGEC